MNFEPIQKSQHDGLEQEKDEIQLLRTHLTHSLKEAQQAKARVSSSREQVAALEAEVMRLNANLEESRIAADRNTAENDRLIQGLLKKHHQELKLYQGVREKLLKEVQMYQHGFQAKEIEANALNQKIEVIEKQKQVLIDLEAALREQIAVITKREMDNRESFLAEIEKERASNQRLEKRIKDLSEARLNEKTQTFEVLKDLDARTLQVQNREDRIRAYSSKIREQKTKLNQIVEKVRQEMVAASAMNPAKDLLKLTEYELSKLQSELIKTPTSNSERRNLEKTADQLLDQIVFLRQVCSESNGSWSVRIAKIQDLARDLSHDSLPPLPPVKIA